jgi:hypothetical protein
MEGISGNQMWRYQSESITGQFCRFPERDAIYFKAVIRDGSPMEAGTLPITRSVLVRPKR